MRKYKASVSAVTTDQITIQVMILNHDYYDDHDDYADNDGDDGDDEESSLGMMMI